jgi:hypothetical protein
MRHELLAAAVRRVASSAGLPSNREASCRRLAVSAAEAEAAGLTRSEVVVMAPDGTLFPLDIVVTPQHVGCKLVECLRHAGKAAALAAADKRDSFACMASGAVHICAICGGVSRPALQRGRRLLAHVCRMGRGLWTAGGRQGRVVDVVLLRDQLCDSARERLNVCLVR